MTRVLQLTAKRYNNCQLRKFQFKIPSLMSETLYFKPGVPNEKILAKYFKYYFLRS